MSPESLGVWREAYQWATGGLTYSLIVALQNAAKHQNLLEDSEVLKILPM